MAKSKNRWANAMDRLKKLVCEPITLHYDEADRKASSRINSMSTAENCEQEDSDAREFLFGPTNISDNMTFNNGYSDDTTNTFANDDIEENLDPQIYNSENDKDIEDEIEKDFEEYLTKDPVAKFQFDYNMSTCFGNEVPEINAVIEKRYYKYSSRRRKNS